MVDLGAEQAGAARLPSRARPTGALGAALQAYTPASAFPRWHSDWAWENYPALVLELARRFQFARVCEIGGGRDPLFSAEEARRHGLSLVLNDIDPAELAAAPDGFETACFDITAPAARVPVAPESYDMMIARMVFEHLPDVPAAWANIHRLLKPGGIGLAFFPTLYAWPYVINHLMPHEVSRRLVTAFFPNRRDGGGDPVFPAHYHHCFGSSVKQARMLAPLGFSEIEVLPFWGHGYLKRVPVLREIDAAFNRGAAAIDWRFFTTYAYVIVRK